MKPIRYGLLLVLCLLLPMAARAQDRDEGSTEKRRLVYVPQDQLDVLVEKHGQGVLLDMKEYLKLWGLAERGGLTTVKPPVTGAVLLGGTVTGQVTDDRVDLTVNYRVRLLSPGIQRVDFPMGNVAVGTALADGKTALLSHDAGGTYLLLQGEGDHEVEIAFTGKMLRKEELHTFSCRLPTGAGLAVDFAIPPGMEPDEGSFGRLYRAMATPQGTNLRAQVPANGLFHFAYRPALEEGSRAVLVHSRGRTLSRVGPRLLTTVCALEVFIYRQALGELILEVPADMAVTEVAAPDLVGFDPADDGSVRLAFKRPVTGRIPVVLKMERSLAGPGELVLPEVKVRSAVDERGLIAVAFTSGIEGRVINAVDVAREPLPGQTDAKQSQADPGQQMEQNRAPTEDQLFLGGAQALYRYWSKGRSLTVRTSQPERRITADVTQVVTLGSVIREIRVSFTYESEGGRIYQLNPSLPPEWELAGVKIEAPAVSRHERRPDGTLTVDFPSGVAAGTPVRITAHFLNFDQDWRGEDWTNRTMPLPVARVGAGVEVRGGLVVFAGEEFEVRDSKLTGLSSEPVELFGQAGARLGYRWRTADATGTLAVARRAPKVSVRYLGFGAPGEKTVQYTGFLHYRIQRAGIRSFKFVVSGGHGDRLHVVGPMNSEPVRRRLEDGNDLYTISLPARIKGEVKVVLSLEEELGQDGFTFPQVKVQDVEDETGYLAVESGDNMEVTVTPLGLREIGLEEMSPLMSTVGYRPARGLLVAYQYLEHPQSLTMKTERFEDAKVLTAFVQHGHLLSLVAKDGSIRTRATYRILNADRQFLKVKLPTGAHLWGALVGGKAVKPSRGNGVDLIPLVTTTGDAAVTVVLMYESQHPGLDSSGKLSLKAPALVGATGAEADWDVWFPSGYQVVQANGVFGAEMPPAPDPWLFRALGEFFDGVGGAFTAYGPNLADNSAVMSQEIAGDDYEVDELRSRMDDRGVAATRVAPPAAKPRAPRMEARPMEQEEKVIEDPVIKDAKMSDHNETDNDLPFEESLGDKDFLSDAPFDGPSTNAAIGVGGGAGGRFGGRGGRRQVQTRLGRAGGLSLDVPIVAGGSHQAVSALGISGNVNLTYILTPARTAWGYVLSVVAALVALFMTGMQKRTSRYVAPLVWVVVVGTFATFAPAWLGSRDLTYWDAIASGTFWAGGIMIVIGIARKFSAWAKPAATAAVLLLAVALFASSAQAGGKPKPPPAATDAETIYVPYDPAHPDSLDGLGKVFIPFARFREIWNAAHPGRKFEEPMKAPVPWLVTGASYEGVVDGETAGITATYDLIVLSEDWVEVALPLSPAVVEEALVDGEPVRVLSKQGAHVLIIRGAGARRVTLKLRALLTQEGDRLSLNMALPAIPRTVLGFELPFLNADVTLAGPCAPRIDGTRLSASLGPVGKLALSFRPKTESPRIESRVEVESREMLNVRDGLVQFRLQSEFRVVTGGLTEVEFQSDPAYEIVEILGNEVKSWSLADDRIKVLLGKRVEKSTVVTVVAELADGIRGRAVTVPAFAPLGAVFERGVLGVAAAADLRVTLSEQRNLDRVGAAVPGLADLITGPSVLHSAWRFVLRPLQLVVTTEAYKAEIRVQVPVQHLVDREWLVSRASFQFDVRGDGTFEFPVTIPADVEIESVKGNGLERWWRDGDTLTFSTRSPVRGGFTVHVVFRRPLDPAVARIDLPEIHANNVSRERGWILVSHAPGLSLTLLDDTGLVKEPIGQYAKWEKIFASQTNVYGYRQDGERYRLAVARTFPEARVTPFSTSRLQVEDDRVVVDTQFVFIIENAGEDTFKVFLPEGEGEEPILEAEKTRSIVWEAITQDGRKGKMLTIVLQQNAIGSYEFRLVYEKRLAAVAGVEREWEALVHAPEPQGENASCYAFALNLSSGEVTFGKPEGLTDADPQTFPRMLDESVLPRHLILQGWHGRGAGFSLPVQLRIHSFADFPDALISSADLLCTVGRDGWTCNRMTYTVLNRTRQFLEVTMPKGAVLEAVRVGGEPVKPGRRRAGAKERILIPLVRMQVGDVSTEVQIFWTRALGNPDQPVDLARIGELVILEPEIYGLEVEQTFYTVNLPEGYGFSFDGNMQQIGEARRLIWQYEKAVEEQERVVQVQTKGNLAQQARADESGLRNSLNIEVLEQQLQSADMTREDMERLETALRRNRVALENFGDNFSNRITAKDGTITEKQDLAKAAEQTKKLAEDRVQQEYRYKGKSNVVSQKWVDNPNAAFEGPGTNAAIGLSNKQQVGEVARSELRAEWQRAFEEVRAAAIPQTSPVLYLDRANLKGAEQAQITLIQDGAFQLESDVNMLPTQSGAEGYDWGGGGGGSPGGGTYRGPRGEEVPPGQRDAADPRPPAELRAGLLSLPVTVPTRGRTFRFEKLNGGARLDISVDREETADRRSGWGQFGLFALILAGLGVFYRFRPDQRIPYFRPVLLFLVSFPFLVNNYGWPLLGLLMLVVAVAWSIVEWRSRKGSEAVKQ